jgi:hypothetical protein
LPEKWTKESTLGQDVESDADGKSGEFRLAVISTNCSMDRLSVCAGIESGGSLQPQSQTCAVCVFGGSDAQQVFGESDCALQWLVSARSASWWQQLSASWLELSLLEELQQQELCSLATEEH